MNRPNDFWDFFIRNRKGLLGIVILVSLGLAYSITFLQIDFSFDSFYPKDNPDSQYYAQYQEHFSEDQNYVIQVALKSPAPTVFDQTFLEEADQIFRQIQVLPGVDSMLAATTVPQIRRSALGIRTQPWLDFSTPKAVKASQRRIEADSTLIGSFITRDRQYLCAIFYMDGELFDTPGRDELSMAIDEVLQDSPFPFIVSGIPYIRSQYVRKIGEELILFLSLSVVLIVSTLFLTYRTFWGVVIPVVAVFTGLTWVMGSMGVYGESINLINNLMIPIIFVVGISDVIHLVTKYFHEIRAGNERRLAIHNTLKEIGLATLLTSITTSIGFLSLLVSRVPPIRSFGLFAALGVLFTYIISIVIIPNALMLFRPEALMRTKSLQDTSFWERWLDRINQFTLRSPRQITIGALAILGLCLFLMTQISLNTYLLEDIGKKDPVRKAMTFFEENAYGLRSFEMGITTKGEAKVTDLAVLEEMDKLQDFLNSQEKFSPFFSVVTLLEQGNYIYHFNRKNYLKLPSSQEEVDELLTLAESQQASLLNSVISPDRSMARIHARMPDVGTDAFQELSDNLDEYVQTSCDTTLFSYRLTGNAFLTEQNFFYLRNSLLSGLFIAFVVIGVLMGVLFRSWKMMLISMVPNIIPLLLTGGIMGLFGIKLTPSTSIVFVIAFGIAVDDTIHFLTRYQLERREGRSVEQAIRATMLGTGKAIILTSLVLLSGFVLLLASTFGGTFNTGLFTALTILFALLADLLLLPILLRWVGE